MKVIYCEFHQSLARSSDSRCDWSMARGDEFYGGAECRMVPMRLIPDNAEEQMARIWHAEVSSRTGVNLSWEAAYESERADFLNMSHRVLAVLDGETP